MTENSGIGSRLREFSENFGGPSGLAKAMGVSPQHLNDYLNGRRTVGMKMQARLRKVGCDIEWLITGKSHPDDHVYFTDISGLLKAQGPNYGRVNVRDYGNLSDNEIILRVIAMLIDTGKINDPEGVDEKILARAVNLYRSEKEKLNGAKKGEE